VRGGDAASKPLVEAFLDSHAPGPFGWTHRELFARAANSPAAREALRQLRRQLVTGAAARTPGA